MDLKIWAPLSCVSQSILDKVRLAYVFGLHGHDALLVTEDDEVLACGSNKFGCLGLGGCHPSLSLRSVVALRRTGVKGFSFGNGSTYTFMVAYTSSGKVYAWGRRIGEQDEYQNIVQDSRLIRQIVPPKVNSTPKLVIFPTESIQITDVACGTSHCLALSMEGKVYSWGFNNVGQLGNGSFQSSVVPTAVEGDLKSQRVCKISCGNNFSVVLLENGNIYAWGDNKYGQVGLNLIVVNVPVPTKIRGFNDVIIKDIVCGMAHVVVVTNVGSMYSWGKNSRCELGLGDSTPRCIPEMIPTCEKFVDIAATYTCSISAAMNDKSEVFRWGDFTDFYCSSPRKTPYKSLQEVFAQFASPRIMFKPVVRESQSKPTCVPPSEEFDDKMTSDLTIVAETKKIFVHRDILTSRSEYFRTFLQEHWVKRKQRILPVDQPYEVIYSYLQYIYTGEIKADPSVAPALLSLADEYQDLTFKFLCEDSLEFDIKIDNVANLFALASKLRATKLLGKCITFAGCHISEVLSTPAISKWDRDTMQEFMMLCKEKQLFRS